MAHFQFALSVNCPTCRAGAGHWCRENGKCVPPHRGRAKEAIKVACAVFQSTSTSPAAARVPDGN